MKVRLAACVKRSIVIVVRDHASPTFARRNTKLLLKERGPKRGMTEVGDQYTGFEMHLDFGRAAECEIFILRRRFMLVYVTNSTLHRMQIPASISLAYNCLFRMHAI